MSEHTQPRTRGLHSHATAAIGARLFTNAPGRSVEHANLVWLFILSHSPWETTERHTWATNETLACESGLELRYAARALQRLREADMIRPTWGIRPGAARKFGRRLGPVLGSPCKVLVPDRHDMANLWELCRERRKRPATMVTMMVGAYALAADNAGLRFDEWCPLGCSQADWRRFVGARKTEAWTVRVRECEAIGLIRRSGRVVEVAPPRSWSRTWRAMESVAREADEHCDRPTWPWEDDPAFAVTGWAAAIRLCTHALTAG